jgi:hypothetical protein
MIGKLEVGDWPVWPLSPKGQGWALYVRMGCLQQTQTQSRVRGETLADLRVYDCQRP